MNSKFIIIAISIFLFGCTPQPSFNPNIKGIEFIKGRPYIIPNKVTFGKPLTKKSAYSMKKESRGECREGDVWWIGFPYGVPGRMAIKASSEKEVQYHFDMRHTGCAHPLTKQEYQYYLNQQNQAAANARAAAYYKAATAPKNVNINHTGFVNYTGTVYHY